MKQSVHSIVGRGGRSSGAALVITLAILILVTALVLSMFNSVTSERSDTAANANLSDSKRLANMTVELVKSTITQATLDTDSSGNHTAWASQPGMIRTWDINGNLNRAFRLYSSGTIVTTSSTVISNDAAALASWRPTTGTTSSYNALWCDLNAPGLSSTGARVYPIVTPPQTSLTSAATDLAYGVPIDTMGTASNDGTANGVQGFSITTFPGYSGSASSTNNPVPMPVKWLYVLQDGEFVSPTGSYTAGTIAGASASNPIIARVAYWTDDETSKVNINTASEGVFWQYPRAAGGGIPAPGNSTNFTSGQLACYQPSRNEFQRYPGHPATVSLSSVLQSGSTPLTLTQIYNLVPRIQQGGSYGGTQWPSTSNFINLSNDVDRLYASPDELLYSGSALSSGTRATNNPLTATDISTRAFFLTACSRAPETTLFETPRVSIWPTMTSGTCQDSFDKLLNFCATCGTTYYFQREKAQSTTYDWLVLTRNQQLFNYLQQMTSTSIPGFGASDFKTKYPGSIGSGQDRDQILTEIFDYIRSGPNLMGAGFAVNQSIASATNAQAFASQSYSFNPGDLVHNPNTINAEANYVAPISITTAGPATVSGNTKGFGNGVHFINQLGIGFFCEGMQLTGSNGVTITGTESPPIPFGGTNSKISYTIRAAPLIQMMRPTTTWDILRMGTDSSGNYSTYYKGLFIQLSFPSGMPTISGTSGPATTLNFPANDLFPVPSYMSMSPIISAARFFNWDGLAVNYYSDSVTRNSVYPPPGRPLISTNQVTLKYDNPMMTSTTSIFSVDPTKWDHTTWATGTTCSSQFAPNYAAAYDTSVPMYTTISGTCSFIMNVSQITMTVTLLNSDSTTVLQTATVSFPAKSYPVPCWNFDETLINASNNSQSPSNALITSGSTLAHNLVAASGTCLVQNNFDWVKTNFLNRFTLDITGTTNFDSPVHSWRANLCYDPYAVLGVDGDVILTQEMETTDLAGKGYSFKGDARLSAIWGLTAKDLTLAPAGFRNPLSGTMTIPLPLLPNHGVTSLKNFSAICGSGGSMMRTSSTTGTLLNSGSMYQNPTTRSLETEWPLVSTRTNGVLMDLNGGGGAGDWDNDYGSQTDGPLLNYPDTGTIGVSATTSIPYDATFSVGITGTLNAAAFVGGYSPNRQMYSPFQFGSLPSRVMARDPWETLLFCPNPAAGRANHRGYNIAPKDYLLGDLFWMPIVDPYPISESFSTAGKINLNSAIAPFNYITRKTGLWALLKSSRITAVSSTNNYKQTFSKALSPGISYVYPIDVAETLKGADDYVTANGMFKSPTEIAEIFLVPSNQSLIFSGISTRETGMNTWWGSYQCTGDNTREQPYAYLLPRLTTKSNTYTVHYRVQTLKKIKNDPNQNQWVEGRDQVVSEFRGSATIERYIDPNDPALSSVDFASLPATALTSGSSLANYYRWRTVQQKQFIP